MPLRPYLLIAIFAVCAERHASGEDFFLTIGGGYAPSGNQASLENNVLFFQRVLREQGADHGNNDIYFADGNDRGKDLQVMDPDSIPLANQLMAEFFGSRSSLGLSYRNHKIPNVRGNTRPEQIRKWFSETGSKMKAEDRLMLFVTAHGNRSRDSRNPYDTTIATWDNTSIKMTEFVKLLDGLPSGVQVIAVMVQCHAGGFAKFIFNGGDPDRGLSSQNRCGFFATVHDRSAAGCTPEVDEKSYVEYSTYFWAALSGRSRTGDPIERPDYNGDGVIGLDEAHAYTVLTADTIDLPIKSSGEFLSEYSKFAEEDSALLSDEEPYSLILELASATDRAVLEGLSEQLDLKGEDRLTEAGKEARPERGRGRSRRRREESPSDRLKHRIANDIERRWPELANVVNPVAVELMTSRSGEFIDAIQQHADYQRYRELTEQPETDEAKRRVKYERFLRTADNVVLAENLKRIGNRQHLDQYKAILDAEAGPFIHRD
ncbi:hypothetical protein NHH03_27170 [Stieleria sp. TO1_6]|uniref:hypothetical protein n=1 Tax=Stieleria tagensis TaxID=2956795 RepID=UPI00209B0EBD|nr:hypothetical protein [Stieleria tagensis]MCO8125450.1 hypothetical protein [Stieleria tagensis]